MKSLPYNLLLVVLTTFFMSSLTVAQDGTQVKDLSGAWIDAGGTLIVVPKSRKTIAAHSLATATWARVEFDSPLDKEVKVVSSGALAAFQTGGGVYAFSTATGK